MTPVVVLDDNRVLLELNAPALELLEMDGRWLTGRCLEHIASRETRGQIAPTWTRFFCEVAGSPERSS